MKRYPPKDTVRAVWDAYPFDKGKEHYALPEYSSFLDTCFEIFYNDVTEYGYCKEEWFI